MLLSKTYPLLDDLGFPNGVSVARRRWAAEARRIRTRSRNSTLLTVVGLTLLFGCLGMLPWIAERVFTAERLQQHMSSRMPMGNAHLGAEYYNIAAAINDGRGFSDPFITPSGPTAWMPPLLVWLQAGLIWLFGGDRFWVMMVVVTLKTLLLAGCGALIVRHGLRFKNGWVAAGVCITFLVAHFWDCFKFTHDGWLILAGVTTTVFGMAKLQKVQESGDLGFGTAILWGGLGGLVALTSPIAGFAWATGTTCFLVRKSFTKLVVAAIMSMLLVAPWAMRNKAVLGKFVPVKSNVFFEFDQSLALDSDGLLDWRTMSLHPYHVNEEQAAYVSLGEIAYLETKKERFLNQVASKRSEFYTKIRNRFVATTLWPAGFNGISNPLRWLLYPWPAVVVVGLLVFGRPLSPLQRAAIIIYIAYLFPYVLCSYYPRYGFPLFAVKILLCYWGLMWALTRIDRMRPQLA